jgi:phosphatidylserine/phosphatidylglycerophosphate/cardiolipin synthase-like enzyme
MYQFTDPALLAILRELDRNNVEVTVITSTHMLSSKGSAVSQLGRLGDTLLQEGSKIRVFLSNPPHRTLALLRKRSALQHNKYFIIDEQIVVTGSANWTGAGLSKNQENCLVLRVPAITQQYVSSFNRSLESVACQLLIIKGECTFQ